MNLNHLVDPYLKLQHLVRKDGSSAAPLLHIFLLDVAYQLYSHELQKLDFKHQAKKSCTTWGKTYKTFNKFFFSAYDMDMQDEIIDLMEDFTKHMHNHIMVTKIAVMNQLQDNGISTDEQMNLSALMIFNILCQEASISYEKIYNRKNGALSSLELHSKKMMQEYFWDKQFKVFIDPNKDEAINKAVEILGDKIVEFCRNLDNG